MYALLQAGSSGGKKGEDVKGDMLKPSSVNTPWVRAMSVLTLPVATILTHRPAFSSAADVLFTDRPVRGRGSEHSLQRV